MQIPVGAGEYDLFADDPPQRDGNRRRRSVPHSRVADQSDIGFQLFRVLREKGR